MEMHQCLSFVQDLWLAQEQKWNILAHLTPRPMKAYSCCLLGPQSFSAYGQEHLERVQDESSAAEEHKKNCQVML